MLIILLEMPKLTINFKNWHLTPLKLLVHCKLHPLLVSGIKVEENGTDEVHVVREYAYYH